MSLALRSAIFFSAISRSWARVTEPTLSFCGMPEPLGTPAALISSRAAGGVFRMNVNDPVLVHADLGRHDVTALRLGLRVVRLAELHDVHAVLTERGADRRRRGGLARRQLQREGLDELLLRRHVSSWAVIGCLTPPVRRTARRCTVKRARRIGPGRTTAYRCERV